METLIDILMYPIIIVPALLFIGFIYFCIQVAGAMRR